MNDYAIATKKLDSVSGFINEYMSIRAGGTLSSSSVEADAGLKELEAKIVLVFQEVEDILKKLRVTSLQENNRDLLKRIYNLEKDLSSARKKFLTVGGNPNAVHRSQGGVQQSHEPGVVKNVLRDGTVVTQNQLHSALVQLSDVDLAIQREREQVALEIADSSAEMYAAQKVLHHQVFSQAQNVDTIERTVEESRDNVVEGNRQLTKAQKYLSSYRKKWLLVLLLLIAIVLAIVIPVVVMKKDITNGL